MKVRMMCAKSTQRYLRQIDPATKQEVKGTVHDVEMVIATANGAVGQGPAHPENKDAFIGSHNASLVLTAASMPFACGKEYTIEIAEASESPTS